MPYFDLLNAQEGIYDDFVAAVTEKVAKFKMGSGMDPDVTLGPLISQAAVERVSKTLNIP